MSPTLILAVSLSIHGVEPLGTRACNEGRFAAGLELLREAGPAARAKLAACLNNAAEAERTAFQLESAEAYARETVELATLLADATLRGHAHNTLAHVLHDAHKLDGARREYEAAIRIRRETGGVASLASTLSSYSSLLLSAGDLTGAETAGMEAVRLLRNLDADHPWLSTAANNLAQVYRLQRRYAEAEPLYKQAIRLAIRHYGPDSRNAALLQTNFAAYYREIGRTQASAAMLRRARTTAMLPSMTAH